MIKYVVRDQQGNILRTGHCQEIDLPLQAQAGEVAEENTQAVRDDTHYWNGTAYAARMVMGLSISKTTFTADNVDEVVISNIPAGTRVNGVLVNDGQIEYTSNRVGKHTLVFMNVPDYQTERVELVGV